jgi:hypothetical protein
MKHFSWQTPEYPYTEKSSDWFWTIGIITAALVVTSIIFGNLLFGLVLALGSFTLTMFAARKPGMVTVEVDDKGIKLNKVLYPFNTLDAFSLDEEHHAGPRLLLKSKKVVMPLVSVPVVLENHEELREFLSANLSEESLSEGFLQTIFERLGF